MARIDNLNHFLTDVASSIKTKAGLSGTIKPAEFDTKINAITTEAPLPNLQVATVTPTVGGFTVLPDSDHVGLSQVTVEGDSNLQPSNIKNGVNIFGVSGNYGGIPDYSEIGSNISVQASQSVRAGQPIIGVLNNSSAGMDANFITTNIEITPSSGKYKICSDDFEIVLGNATVSGVEVFHRVSNTTYEQMSCTIHGDYANAPSFPVKQYASISTDGKLALWYQSGTKAIVGEINRENNTVDAYVIDLPLTPKTNTYISCLNRNLIFISDTSYNVKLLHFSNGILTTGNTNTFSSFNLGTGGISNLYSPVAGELLFYYFLSPNYYVRKITYDTTNYNILTTTTFTLSELSCFSPHYNYYTLPSSGNYGKIYAFDYISMTSTLYTTLTSVTEVIKAIDDSASFVISGTTYAKLHSVLNDSLIVTTDKNISSYGSTKTFISSNLKYSIGSYLLAITPNTTSPQYLISPALTNTIVANKIYGIANETLATGDVGNARLLFSSY